MKRDEVGFTGERLHEGDALFGADLARHRAAYAYAIRVGRELGVENVLELGSGTGYGTAELALALPRVVAVDRVAPPAGARRSNAAFVRGDLNAMPLALGRFDLLVSFQVLEHLRDPGLFLRAAADHLRASGLALLTTPNRLESDGENPFHVHEYDATELEALLCEFFEEVEILAVSATGPARSYHEARLARIRRLVRIDPLGLRRWIPRALLEWLFARLAIRVRRGIARSGNPIESVGIEDFPIEPAHPRALDLVAICRRPRSRTGSGA